MKIYRNFVHGEEKYTVEEECNDIQKCGKTVIYRGRVWQWQYYDDCKTPAELVYTEVPERFIHDVVADEIVGRFKPKKVKCDCGCAAVGSLKHMDYCSIMQIDPWEED